jgi:hypothetical protein
MTPLPFYKPKFYRHLNHLIINGFYARDLDADDHAFIDHVRERGTVGCGSLANFEITDPGYDPVWRPPVRPEEANYWYAPYGVEPGVARRSGQEKRHEDSKAQQAAREQSAAIRRARLAHRLQERAATEAEWRREHEQWEKWQAELAAERQQRLKQTMRADMEWERANPVRARRERHGFDEYGEPPDRYSRVGRHYVPHWKREERAQQEDAREKEAQEQRTTRHRKMRAKSEKLLHRTRAANAAAEAEAAKQAVAASFSPVWEIEWQNDQAATFRRRQAAQTAALEREQEQRAARLQELQEETVARAEADRLKGQIMLIIRGTAPRVWEVEDLMVATYCSDRDLMVRCCEEIMRAGLIRKADVPERS